MANKDDLEYTYSDIDHIFRLSLGETGDFSGAFYNGDFSLSLEEAQRRKHQFIVDQLHISAGSRVLDMGCGWGGFLKYAQELGATGIGVTLSSRQAVACRNNDLDVHVLDCRALTPDDFGRFDAIVSLGAFEHFCSEEDWQAGRQEDVYQSLFHTVYELLVPGGRFFLQTMVFGDNMVDYEEISLNADEQSDGYMLALLRQEFPGSWLPFGDKQVLRTAEPYFTLVFKSSGRLDYIETITQWNRKFAAFNLRKYLLYLTLVPRYLADSDVRERVRRAVISPNRVCFERQILDHYRFVFERNRVSGLL